VVEGSGINPLYLPSLAPELIKIMKLLPLWSAVMLPIFKYGEEVCSSAAIESSFKKLKNITLQHVDLPTNLETFLENHILSLKGASLIKVPKTNSANDIEVMTESKDLNMYSPTIEIVNDCRSPTPPLNEMTQFHNLDKNDDMLSKNKVQIIEEVTTENHRQHINYEKLLSQTSEIISNSRSPSPLSFELMEYQDSDGNDGLLVQTQKSYNNIACEFTNLNEEQVAVEGWNRQNKQRKTKSYLIPNPHLRYLDLTL